MVWFHCYVNSLSKTEWKNMLKLSQDDIVKIKINYWIKLGMLEYHTLLFSAFKSNYALKEVAMKLKAYVIYWVSFFIENQNSITWNSFVSVSMHASTIVAIDKFR